MIFVAGGISSGKTRLIAQMMRQLDGMGIPYTREIVTDSTSLTDAVRRDHEVYEGIHHKHRHDEEPHAHAFDPLHEYESFINTHPMMQHLMNQDFMRRLEAIPKDGRVTFAEAAIGVNGLRGNPNDYSAQRMVDELRRGTLPPGWISKVDVFVHITAPYSLRVNLNEGRLKQPFRAGGDMTGEMSRAVPPEVMPFTHDDDISVLVSYLRDVHHMKSDRVITVANDGTAAFLERNSMRIIERMMHGGTIEGRHVSPRKEL